MKLFGVLCHSIFPRLVSIRVKSLQTKHASLLGLGKSVPGSPFNPAVVVLCTRQGWDLLPQGLLAWQCLDVAPGMVTRPQESSSPWVTLVITRHTALSSHSTDVTTELGVLQLGRT